MKTYKLILLWLLVFSVASGMAAKKPGSTKRTLQQKIESNDFTVYVSRCLPTDLENSPFNSDVALKIKNDTASANLPFHGLQNIKQLETLMDPINFNGPMKDFTITHNPDKSWNLLFNVESNPYFYQVQINVSAKGKAIVKIASSKRTTMTYFGDVD